MASYYYGGKVKMKPELKENVGNDYMEDDVYPLAFPIL